MQSLAFAQLGEEHFEAAYRIVVKATSWLNAKGVRQWDEPIPEDIYRDRNRQGLNYGLFSDHDLAVVMTLKEEPPAYWAAVRDFAPPLRWLSTLAVDRAHAGKGLAHQALRKAEAYLADQGIPRLYLDCVDREGALPRFYTAAGYTMLDRRDWQGWPMCLFGRDL